MVYLRDSYFIRMILIISLTDLNRMLHICVSKRTVIGSDKGCRHVGPKPLPEPILEYC